jgi:hypothetical protein
MNAQLDTDAGYTIMAANRGDEFGRCVGQFRVSWMADIAQSQT